MILNFILYLCKSLFTISCFLLLVYIYYFLFTYLVHLIVKYNKTSLDVKKLIGFKNDVIRNDQHRVGRDNLKRLDGRDSLKRADGRDNLKRVDSAVDGRNDQKRVHSAVDLKGSRKVNSNTFVDSGSFQGSRKVNSNTFVDSGSFQGSTEVNSNFGGNSDSCLRKSINGRSSNDYGRGLKAGLDELSGDRRAGGSVGKNSDRRSAGDSNLNSIRGKSNQRASNYSDSDSLLECSTLTEFQDGDVRGFVRRSRHGSGNPDDSFVSIDLNDDKIVSKELAGLSFGWKSLKNLTKVCFGFFQTLNPDKYDSNTDFLSKLNNSPLIQEGFSSKDGYDLNFLNDPSLNLENSSIKSSDKIYSRTNLQHVDNPYSKINFNNSALTGYDPATVWSNRFHNRSNKIDKISSEFKNTTNESAIRSRRRGSEISKSNGLGILNELNQPNILPPNLSPMDIESPSSFSNFIPTNCTSCELLNLLDNPILNHSRSSLLQLLDPLKLSNPLKKTLSYNESYLYQNRIPGHDYSHFKNSSENTSFNLDKLKSYPQSTLRSSHSRNQSYESQGSDYFTYNQNRPNLSYSNSSNRILSTPRALDSPFNSSVFSPIESNTSHTASITSPDYFKLKKFKLAKRSTISPFPLNLKNEEPEETRSSFSNTINSPDSINTTTSHQLQNDSINFRNQTIHPSNTNFLNNNFSFIPNSQPSNNFPNSTTSSKNLCKTNKPFNSNHGSFNRVPLVRNKTKKIKKISFSPNVSYIPAAKTLDPKVNDTSSETSSSNLFSFDPSSSFSSVEMNFDDMLKSRVVINPPEVSFLNAVKNFYNQVNQILKGYKGYRVIDEKVQSSIQFYHQLNSARFRLDVIDFFMMIMPDFLIKIILFQYICIKLIIAIVLAPLMVMWKLISVICATICNNMLILPFSTVCNLILRNAPKMAFMNRS